MRLILLASAAVLVGLGSVRAEDDLANLVITVHPSGYEGRGETLDERLARRERGFRFICLGCVRGEGRVDSTTPFRPIDTLNAPQLTAALAGGDGSLASGGSRPMSGRDAGAADALPLDGRP